MSYLTNPNSALPPRGTILCIFKDSMSAISLERQFVSKGYTVLRARHGMHGYWLALSSRPDAVVTDLIDPAQESDYIIELLQRNEKTRRLPLMALVSGLQQEAPTTSCLSMVDVVLRANTPVEEIIRQLDSLVEANEGTQAQVDAQRQTIRRTRSGTYTRFDDYFARLGASELRRMRPTQRPHLPIPDAAQPVGH